MALICLFSLVLWGLSTDVLASSQCEKLQEKNDELLMPQNLMGELTGTKTKAIKSYKCPPTDSGSQANGVCVDFILEVNKWNTSGGTLVFNRDGTVQTLRTLNLEDSRLDENTKRELGSRYIAPLPAEVRKKLIELSSHLETSETPLTFDVLKLVPAEHRKYFPEDNESFNTALGIDPEKPSYYDRHRFFERYITSLLKDQAEQAAKQPKILGMYGLSYATGDIDLPPGKFVSLESLRQNRRDVAAKRGEKVTEEEYAEISALDYKAELNGTGDLIQYTSVGFRDGRRFRNKYDAADENPLPYLGGHPDNPKGHFERDFSKPAYFELSAKHLDRLRDLLNDRASLNQMVALETPAFNRLNSSEWFKKQKDSDARSMQTAGVTAQSLVAMVEGLRKAWGCNLEVPIAEGEGEDRKVESGTHQTGGGQ